MDYLDLLEEAEEEQKDEVDETELDAEDRDLLQFCQTIGI